MFSWERNEKGEGKGMSRNLKIVRENLENKVIREENFE